MDAVRRVSSRKSYPSHSGYIRPCHHFDPHFTVPHIWLHWAMLISASLSSLAFGIYLTLHLRTCVRPRLVQKEAPGHPIVPCTHQPISHDSMLKLFGCLVLFLRQAVLQCITGCPWPLNSQSSCISLPNAGISSAWLSVSCFEFIVDSELEIFLYAFLSRLF